MSDDSDKHYELAVALSRDALKAILLVNGGAATALIALTDKTSKDYSIAVLFFGCGAIAAVVSTCLGYLSQLNYANHRLDVSQGDAGNESHTRHERLQSFITIFVLASLAFSIAGMATAALVARGP